MVLRSKLTPARGDKVEWRKHPDPARGQSGNQSQSLRMSLAARATWVRKEKVEGDGRPVEEQELGPTLQ